MKLIILYLICSCFVLTAVAQTNYYANDRTFYEDGYTYQCDVQEGAKFVTLYNKSNKFTKIEQVNRYTGESISIEQNRRKQFEADSWTKSKCYFIVNNAFSLTEKRRVKGNKFIITMYIDPDTGKVVDVEFQFLSIKPYATIPLSVYREIEIELKKNIWFTITDEGKKRNYIVLGWLQEPK